MQVEEVFSSKPRMKIMKIIAHLGELNISEIARRIKVNYSTTNQHLRVLEDENIFRQRTYGRIRLYRFNEHSPKAKAVKNLIEVWEKEDKESDL
ncbi:winged helix-turn-helix transcriptional regulator [Candidatus Bathyarchaeota archaeon]|nr:winged helix-turn-helix transcriptional regulator [Candidatus Bathyarchaeota archaeon]